jgi:hypothetical protein
MAGAAQHLTPQSLQIRTASSKAISGKLTRTQPAGPAYRRVRMRRKRPQSLGRPESLAGRAPTLRREPSRSRRR